ncbi:sulfotransferase [Rhizobium sp. KVB221]|uniref:Sulfotransferase n=1 Tax=Rhizobium setariae TaxID=2801340 RepID=A0A936YMJ8_9HYPH|nr:sulfotransferase [Rhizobium setariae]MBL0373289.1 sulfotransferase [Rhizobium setariae]
MRLQEIDFLIIGATKSATTWLQQSLQQHSAIHMPDPELHYFSRYYERGTDWYTQQFARQPHHRLVGEKSNSYMDTPEAAPRIRRDLPHIRLIAQLRNPVERAYSDYCMLYRRGEVGKDIDQYLDPRLADGGRFLNGGLYYDQLRAFLDLYSSDRLLVLLFENIRTQPQRQLDAVRDFLLLDSELEVPPVTTKVKDKTQPVISPGLRKVLAPLKSIAKPFRQNPVFQAARSVIARELRYPPLSKDLKTRLIDYYAPQVERLGTTTGQDLSAWLSNVVPQRDPAG